MCFASTPFNTDCSSDMRWGVFFSIMGCLCADGAGCTGRNEESETGLAAESADKEGERGVGEARGGTDCVAGGAVDMDGGAIGEEGTGLARGSGFISFCFMRGITGVFFVKD